MKKQKFYNIEHKSFEEVGVKTYQELWAKVKAEGYDGLSLSVITVFNKAADKDNSFHAVFSTANEDRHGDIVTQDWDLRAFKKNSVFLDSHNYDSIVHILGTISNIKQDKVLEGDITFFLENPKGLLAKQAVEGGFLRATSVGFIPKVFDDKGTILKSELLEVSAVSVPANAEALFDKTEKGIKHLKKTYNKDGGDFGVLCMYCNEDISETEKQFALATDLENVMEIVCEKCFKEKTEAPADPAPVVVPAKTVKKVDLNKIVNDMVAEKAKNLKILAKAVTELTEENRMSKKKEIHQIIRGMIKEGLNK